jgi:hypothetical protein
MSAPITPLEQSAGNLAAFAICTIGAKGVPATIVQRAEVVVAISQALGDAGTGNLAAASALILSAIQGNQNLDPALALFLNNALNIAMAQWQAFQAVSSMLPFLSVSIEAAITAFATGLAAGANAELAKYGSPPSAPAPAAAKA